MNPELLKEVQNKTLDVAKEFKRVCEKYNLRYFMSCGTLLGAVRHKGFIPWDDDMDFYMPRSDYEKLVELDRKDCENGTHEVFDKKFIFKHWEKTPNYIWNFGKIEDTTTTCIESTLAENKVKYKGGLGIDIFILDGGGNDILKAQEQFKNLTKYANRRYEKYWKPTVSDRNKFPIKQIKQTILDIRSKLLFQPVLDYFKNKTQRECLKYDFDHSEIIASAFVLCVYPNATHYLKDFIPSIMLEFEDTKFPAPNNYKTYLERLYGDYMTPPPIKERTGHMPYYINLDLPFEEYDPPYLVK
ncbi:LicD family protein [Helicobacter cappadocius]|uniref:LicD family protein n=1 Tax=Helicobacter cappadocius TaxID=3063998 RepID=A0AA90TCM1_9HELI|nr:MULTISPECIES: LicD family protein [unclassified Helicobacter]MDO7253871.1 LicD family protein [Helicobacter sp. faydin-H75]MDP2539811.1 LicD family protein [Helicobacter sp. faydin-H76]